MVRNFDDNIWKKHSMDIVMQGLFNKFNQNKDLKKLLLNTQEKTLVEASPRDLIWGIGLSEKEAKKTNKSNWKGLNQLGICLMNVRDKLKCSNNYIGTNDT
jgi:ribA/ribD-fused uncharacterized protein